ncbi:MAG TPA: hypothetical protein VGH28_24760 [Polyangiaceae bacterium]
MERQPPVLPSDEIDLYVRTYTSLLRSSGRVRVRAFEEAHAYCNSSLHPRALSVEPDVSAFAYAAARLPVEMPRVKLVVLGQSHELFEAARFDVRTWPVVRTRGRRRPLRFDGKTTLGAFIASVSDIDDLIPIVTAYQVEWNKMNARLRRATTLDDAAVSASLGLDEGGLETLKAAFGPGAYESGIAAVSRAEIDLSVQMLASSYSQFQRAAQRWWSGVEPSYVRKVHPRRPPVYFVSSNTHAIANLLGGYTSSHREELVSFIRASNPEGLAPHLDAALAAKDEHEISGMLHYALRSFIHADASGKRMDAVRAFEAESGLVHLSGPGHVDVDVQIVDLAKIDPSRMDPRLLVPGLERLARSEALIVNIDYPLGMAAYHLLSRLGQGVGEMRGVYVMGKAATLNGRVGDVMLSGNVYDEHTRNTFLFENAFSSKDLEPHLKHGSVFDNQAALTVRSAFLQNRNYMNAFYRDGYTVLEMEAGPFLSAVYELVNPTRVRSNEIVHLGGRVPFEVGLLHYASDTPYSRRQELLSKSLSYFGVDSTYACAIAIVRRILERELAFVTRSAL